MVESDDAVVAWLDGFEEQHAELQKRADEIMVAGNPLSFLENAYATNHAGDRELLRAVIYAACLQSSLTSHGIQIFITGGKGKGKSNAVKAALALLPQHAIVNSSFSDKSFFFRLQDRVKPIIYLDDTTLTDYQVSTVKRCMTNFQCRTEYSTVGRDFTVKIFSIPARTIWLGTAVVQEGDDQLKDRFLTLGILPEAKDDDDYVRWEIQRRQEGRPEIDVNEDVAIARILLETIREQDFVVLGFENIKFRYTTDRRLLNIALDLVEASAILNYRQRVHEEKDGIIYIHPSQEDLDAALAFSMFTITDDRAEGRLTRQERVLDECIQKKIQGANIELTEREVVDAYGKATTACRVLLYGRNGTQHDIKGGLLEKAPWYRIDREMVDGKRIGQSVIVVDRHDYAIDRDHAAFAWLDTAGQRCST